MHTTFLRYSRLKCHLAKLLFTLLIFPASFCNGAKTLKMQQGSDKPDAPSEENAPDLPAEIDAKIGSHQLENNQSSTTQKPTSKKKKRKKKNAAHGSKATPKMDESDTPSL